MIQTLILHDKPAVKIHAFAVVPSPSGKCSLYNCEGDKVWIPNSLCKYDAEHKTLLIEEWFYNKLVSEGKL